MTPATTEVAKAMVWAMAVATENGARIGQRNTVGAMGPKASGPPQKHLTGQQGTSMLS